MDNMFYPYNIKKRVVYSGDTVVATYGRNNKLLMFLKDKKIAFILIFAIAITGAIYMANVKYKCQLEPDGDGSSTCRKYRKINGGNWQCINSWPDRCPNPPTCP